VREERELIQSFEVRRVMWRRRMGKVRRKGRFRKMICVVANGSRDGMSKTRNWFRQLSRRTKRTENEASLLLGRLIPMHPPDSLDRIVEDLGPTRVLMRDIEREVKRVPSLAEVAEPFDEAIGTEEACRRILQEVPERLDRRVAELRGEGDERGALEDSGDVPLERCRAMQHRSLSRNVSGRREYERSATVQRQGSLLTQGTSATTCTSALSAAAQTLSTSLMAASHPPLLPSTSSSSLRALQFSVRGARIRSEILEAHWAIIIPSSAVSEETGTHSACT
jgi:hypothetical protein